MVIFAGKKDSGMEMLNVKLFSLKIAWGSLLHKQGGLGLVKAGSISFDFRIV
jgi:hypothetical protein